MRKLKKALPWIALASALVAAGLLVAGSFYRRTRIVDTGETRAVVEKALDELLELRPGSLDESKFLAAFDEFSQSRFVARAVMVDRTLASDLADTAADDDSDRAIAGSVANSGSVTLVIRSSQGMLIESLPHEEFSSDQLLLLAVGSAIQEQDADHNDVSGMLVRTVANPAGDPLGVIGVRYDRSPWVSARPGVAWILLVIGFALSFQMYWISVPAWTFLDARDRGEKAWVWAVFTLVGNVIALVAYLLARAPRNRDGG
jgi:hypothetical protein